MDALSAMLLLGQVQSSSLLDGTYRVALYNSATKKVEPQAKNLPPGQVLHGFIKGNRFAVLNMMSGFQGPIKKDGKVWKFVFEEGPAGKLKGKPDEAVVSPSNDRKTLTLTLKGQTMMVWTWKEAKVPLKLPY